MLKKDVDRLFEIFVVNKNKKNKEIPSQIRN